MGEFVSEEDFNFPGTPYDVQRQLMCAIYDTIENRGVGLFESPTGTGKTLSMICAALTWLQRNRVATSPEEICNDEPAWVGEQALSQAERNSKEQLCRRAKAYRLRVQNVAKQSTHTSHCVHRHSYVARDDAADLFAGIDDIDEDYSKCGDGASVRTAKRNHGSFPGRWVSDVRDNNRFSKVIFATRTHSQLAQFVNELRKTKFNPPSVSEAFSRLTNPDLEGFGDSSRNYEPDLPFALVLFGSRQQMCINEDVRKLSSGSAIAERCRELLEGSDGSKRNSGKRGNRSGRCMYHDEETEEQLKEHLLVGAHEIEDVSKLGRVLGGCPYFATRSAMTDKRNHVDIIGVPYSAILHESTRDAIGISVDEDTVVIFDEGHNVCGAMREVYDCSLDAASLKAGSRLLGAYCKRYFARLSPQSLFRVRQLMAVVEGLASVLKKCVPARVSRVAEIAFDGGIDNVNLFDVIGFLRESGLSKKIRGLAEEDEGKDGEEKPGLHVAKESISKLQRFLEAMCECGEYGRIAIYPGNGKAGNEGRLHHFVVDCGELFAKAVGKARSVLLLGGTLSPRQVLKETLLSDMMRRRQQTNMAGRSRVDVSDVVEFECDHVAQRENVLSRVCPKSPTGTLLEFTYESRGRLDVLDGLGETVLESMQKIDGGVVVFFASYELLRLVTKRWASTGTIGQIGSVKPVVIEERGTNLSWNSYEEQVQKDKKKGAILLAVMGGKLSEGINFSDELGRVVMVVGLPFANMDNVETQERLKAVTNGCPSKKRQLMESECMTIVNQSIGRAVRHANDFAAVLLIDGRFGRQSVLDKLPGFIKRDVRVAQSFAHICDDLNTFFLSHR